MAKKTKSKGKAGARMLPVLHADAAGVDIGAEEIYVAVPAERALEPVRSFGTFTRDLHELADWLQECRVRTVAMESTGVYWIPLYQILETRGFQVFLVNAQHVKNVPGRKSDVSDCQCIQYLHSVGLLKASFRPPDEICVIRSLWRHRESLIHMAAEHIMHMQKALSQMNLHLHHVLSEITGLSGLAILDAILAGERDPVRLASLCNGRVKSPRDKVAKSLEGDYRPEHLFALRQSLIGYRFYQKLIAEVDVELQLRMRELPRAEGAPARCSRSRMTAARTGRFASWPRRWA
jgi:transposase